MKNESTPSDEEIRSYMNFDSLLEKRKMASQKNRLHSVLKWGIPIVMMIGFVTWFVITSDTNTPIDATEITPPIQAPSTNQQVLPSMEGDSIAASSEIEQHQNERPQKNEQSVISKKSVREKKSDAPTGEDLYIQAEPVEGYTKLYDYFSTNLIYPSEALADSIQGVQTISFIVNTVGNPESISVTKSLGPLFEKEARRLIENMPPWKPATLNGKPVPSKVAVPLTFQIEKIKK